MDGPPLLCSHSIPPRMNPAFAFGIGGFSLWFSRTGEKRRSPVHDDSAMDRSFMLGFQRISNTTQPDTISCDYAAFSSNTNILPFLLVLHVVGSYIIIHSDDLLLVLLHVNIFCTIYLAYGLESTFQCI